MDGYWLHSIIPAFARTQPVWRTKSMVRTKINHIYSHVLSQHNEVSSLTSFHPDDHGTGIDFFGPDGWSSSSNVGADYHIQKLMAVFTELIRSGRYANSSVPIETALEDFKKTAAAMFETVEKLGGQAGR